MRPIYLAYPNVGAAGFTTPPVVLDQYISPGNVAVTINLVSGSAPIAAPITLEFTTDNVLDPLVTNYVWQPYSASPFSAAGLYNFTAIGAVEAMFAYAPKAVRVRCGATTGTPTMNVQVIQLGIGGT